MFNKGVLMLFLFVLSLGSSVVWADQEADLEKRVRSLEAQMNNLSTIVGFLAEGIGEKKPGAETAETAEAKLERRQAKEREISKQWLDNQWRQAEENRKGRVHRLGDSPDMKARLEASRKKMMAEQDRVRREQEELNTRNYCQKLFSNEKIAWSITDYQREQCAPYL